MNRLPFATLLLIPLLAACADQDTSFDDAEAIAANKVAVCHMNNGLGEYTIIDVSQNAVDTHLGHGDVLYTDEQSCVCAVLYTCYEGATFHDGASGQTCVTGGSYDSDCGADFADTYGHEAFVTCNGGVAFDCGLDTLAGQNGCECTSL